MPPLRSRDADVLKTMAEILQITPKITLAITRCGVDLT